MRHSLVLGNGLAMAAAAAMLGNNIEPKSARHRSYPLPRPQQRKVKRKPDRTRKQYLLKGIRP